MSRKELQNKLPKHCPKIGDDIFVRSVDRKIELLEKQGFNKFVITDVRFLNEHQFIEQHGITIKLTRTSIKRQCNQHLSESTVDTLKCTHDIINDGSKEDVHHELIQLLREKYGEEYL